MLRQAGTERPPPPSSCLSARGGFYWPPLFVCHWGCGPVPGDKSRADSLSQSPPSESLTDANVGLPHSPSFPTFVPQTFSSEAVNQRAPELPSPSLSRPPFCPRPPPVHEHDRPRVLIGWNCCLVCIPFTERILCYSEYTNINCVTVDSLLIKVKATSSNVVC